MFSKTLCAFVAQRTSDFFSKGKIEEVIRLIINTTRPTKEYAKALDIFVLPEHTENVLINEWLKHTFDPVDDSDEPNEATAFIQKFIDHKYELRDMYLNLTTSIIDHADKCYNLAHPLNKKRFITVHRIMVNGMGLVAKRKRTNPDTPKTDINIESFLLIQTTK